MRRTAALSLVALLLVPASLPLAQGTAPTTPLTLITRDGRRPVPTTLLNGQEFMAFNAGPVFKFNESISFIVNCKDQKEIDYYWSKLSKGGDKKAQMCGWLKDRYGLSWQIVPIAMGRMMKDKKRADSVMAALLKMKKLDIKALEKAYKQK